MGGINFVITSDKIEKIPMSRKPNNGGENCTHKRVDVIYNQVNSEICGSRYNDDLDIMLR